VRNQSAWDKVDNQLVHAERRYNKLSNALSRKQTKSNRKRLKHRLKKASRFMDRTFMTSMTQVLEAHSRDQTIHA
jgi:hypothetical protein